MDSPHLTSSRGGVPAEPSAAGADAGVGAGLPMRGEEPARWVEPDILAELEADLDGPELALGFARDYASLWDQRFSRLAAAVHTEDRPIALDAVISLRIASAMVGGIRLSVLAQALEDAIRRGDFVQGQALLATLAEHGVRTVSELQAKYILKND
ncbi:Hpt domain-containing protein [Pseudarthrobacter sp. MDT3-26]|uniref:Hpt domain-containing protein n=1 Tax=Pseudarthrobacter raffinosi TaxID=2953651 RepID=UPI00208F376F|nr:Hpt domain-containing protein [Pseudarthrobacter sp. MDT3-26]MCO4263356.1 Hpt domain-containing protein [Pseudarthrobacter sp. MDT3-26]